MKRITADSFRNAGMLGFNAMNCSQPEDPTEKLAALKKLGPKLNHVRVKLEVSEIDGVLAVNPAHLKTLDKFATACQAAGLHIVLAVFADQHRVSLWKDTKTAQRLRDSLWLKLWSLFCAKFAGRRVFAGFDFFNEGTYTESGAGAARRYYEAAELFAGLMRQADPNRVPIIQIFPDALAGGPYQFLPPRAIPGVVYQVHDWTPMGYTHTPIIGMDPNDKQRFDDYTAEVRSLHLESLLPALRWANDNNAPLYVGESGCLNTQAGAAFRFELSHAIAKGYGASWAGHEWRGAGEWDPEAVWDQKPTTREQINAGRFVRKSDTDRMDALRRIFT